MPSDRSREWSRQILSQWLTWTKAWTVRRLAPATITTRLQCRSMLTVPLGNGRRCLSSTAACQSTLDQSPDTRLNCRFTCGISPVTWASKKWCSISPVKHTFSLSVCFPVHVSFFRSLRPCYRCGHSFEKWQKSRLDAVCFCDVPKPRFCTKSDDS